MNLEYQNFPDSPTKNTYQRAIFSEHNYYHFPSDRGFFSICQKKNGKWIQDSYELEMMPYVLAHIDKTLDSYISQAEFWRRNRRILGLARLGLCFLDIDIYKTEYRHHKPMQVVHCLLDFCDDNNLPVPSAILHSGGGLYAKWFFDGALPAQALPRWNVLQRELVARFSTFGADPAARDASRVLRIEGTVHTKTGRVVQVLYPSSPSIMPALYSFEELFESFAPENRAAFTARYKTIQPPKPELQLIQGSLDAQAIKRASRNMSLNSPRFGLNAMRLQWDRLGDLRRLASMRGWTAGNPDGSRDPFLFLGVVCMSWLTSPDQLYYEALEMARQWAPQWDHATTLAKASAAVKRAKLAAAGGKVIFNGQEVDPRYRYSTERIVDELGISSSEQRQLKTLAVKEVVADRKKEAATIWRRERGQVAREKYLDQAWISQEKPWRDFGYSRRSWYNKGCPIPERLQEKVNPSETLEVAQVRMYV